MIDPALFESADFLQTYWQKQPLLIRNPWLGWENPLSPEELAGLAGEDGIEARIMEKSANDWSVAHGPFDDAEFSEARRNPWTLLVQAVDQVVPEVAALIDAFRFIPNWRIDDVMVSYATDGGGVGPHFDQYDVFLIQGLGRRRWRIGGKCDERTPLLPHDDVKLLAEFKPTQECVLEPGDILYLPPGIAHDGVALGDDCMTYSIGFRAPARSELIAHFCDHALVELDDDDRYCDPDLPLQANPGEISPQALTELHRMVMETLGNPATFARWFGEYNSAPKYPEQDWSPEEPFDADQVREIVTSGTPLLRNPASRFAFVRQSPSALLLFVDGQCYPCEDKAARVAEQLSAGEQTLDAEVATDDAVIGLLLELLNQGSIGVEDEY